MLKNIIDKETNNVFIPFKSQNDSIQVQAGGVVAWSGYAFIYKTFKTTAFKEKLEEISSELVPLSSQP